MCRLVLTAHQKSKKRRGLCVSFGCRKQHAKQSNSCHSCNKKRYAEANPIKYAYQVTRQNARRRRKFFDLTFEQFKEFCIETKILLGRGIYKDSFHIDRIIESEGYTKGNLQVLTNSENIKKFRHYDWMTKQGYVTTSEERSIDAPF